MISDTGKMGTGFYQGDIADRRLVIDMSKTIHKLNTSDTPFYVMLAEAKKAAAKQPKFEWMEDEDFMLRTFKCNFVVDSDAGEGDTVGYLSLKHPSDMQALEAPPYIATEGNYDTTETTLVKLSIDNDDDGTYGIVVWVILEKAAIAEGGVWQEWDFTASTANAYSPYTLNGGSGTWALDTYGNPTGYIIPLIYATADGSDAVNFGVDTGWHHVTNGAITSNMAVIIDDSSAANGVIAKTSGTNSQVEYTTAEDVTSGTYDCKVQVYTPNLLNKGYFEGSGLPEETRKGVRHLYNYTQIAKTPYTITNTARATSYVGGDELARIRAKKTIQHKIDLEQILLFNGASAIDATTSESPKRTTQGMGVGDTGKLGFIKTHHPGDETASANSAYCIKNAAPDFYEDLHSAFQEIFSDSIQGSTTKTLFVSQKWLGAFSKNAGDSATDPWRVTTNLNSGDANATFGIRVMRYQSPFGLVNIVPAPVLRGYYEDWALMVDFGNIELKVLPGRDTHIVTNAQGNDEDGLKEYLLTEMGLKAMQEHTHGLLLLTST